MVASTQVEFQGIPSGSAVQRSRRAIPVTWLLLSLAVGVWLGFVVLILAMGISLSNRVNDLERDNAGLAANRLADDSLVVDSILQLRVISYWLAYPTNDVLVLEPPTGTGNSQGVLRMADDGLSAMLMVGGLQQLSTSSTYNVWLTGKGRRVQASQLSVDARGWGTTTIYRDEPIFEFDEVEVTTVSEGGPGSAPIVKVLEGKISLRRGAE